MFWRRKNKPQPAPQPKEPARESIHLPHYWCSRDQISLQRLDECHKEITSKVRNFIHRAKDQEGRVKLMVPHGEGVYRVIDAAGLACVLMAAFDIYSGDGWNRFLGFVDADSATRLYIELTDKSSAGTFPEGIDTAVAGDIEL